MAKAPGRGALFDIGLGLVAVIAVAGLGGVGFKVWSRGAGPPPPAQVQVAALAPTQNAAAVWEKADTDACTARARAAPSHPDTGNLQITNRSISEGVAGLSTLVECQLTRKVARFCGAEGNAKLVAIVNDYLGRVDMVNFGVGLQGAPMAVAGAMFGGEPAAGDAMYKDMAEDTRTFMKSYSARVLKAVRALGQNGVVKADDFKPFPFGSVPEQITQMFAGVQQTRNICTPV